MIDDLALEWFRRDAEAQGLSLRVYARRYGLTLGPLDDLSRPEIAFSALSSGWQAHALSIDCPTETAHIDPVRFADAYHRYQAEHEGPLCLSCYRTATAILTGHKETPPAIATEGAEELAA